MKKERVKLTGAEKSELFAEGIVTIILLLLLNLSIIILIHLAILQDELGKWYLLFEKVDDFCWWTTCLVLAEYLHYHNGSWRFSRVILAAN